MSIRKKFLVAAVAVGLAFSPILTSPLAQADSVSAPATQNPDVKAQSKLTGDYLASKFSKASNGGLCIKQEDGDCSYGYSDQAALALLLMGTHRDVVDGYLEHTAANLHVKSPGQAGRFALVVEAAGLDPKNFGGVDLLAKAAEDPESHYGGFSAGLSVLGIVKGGGEVSDKLMNVLLGAQKDNGSFSDPDSSAVAALALIAYKENSGKIDVTDAIAKVKKYFTDTVKSDKDGNFWAGYNPVNTAGYAIQAADLLGLSDLKAGAERWLVAQDKNKDGIFESCGKDNCGSAEFATADGANALGMYNLVNFPTASKPDAKPSTDPGTEPAPGDTPSTPADPNLGNGSDNGSDKGTLKPAPVSPAKPKVPVKLPDTGVAA